jgi:hypothetical protein
VIRVLVDDLLIEHWNACGGLLLGHDCWQICCVALDLLRDARGLINYRTRESTRASKWTRAQRRTENVPLRRPFLFRSSLSSENNSITLVSQVT